MVDLHWLDVLAEVKNVLVAIVAFGQELVLDIGHYVGLVDTLECLVGFHVVQTYTIVDLDQVGKYAVGLECLYSSQMVVDKPIGLHVHHIGNEVFRQAQVVDDLGIIKFKCSMIEKISK
jgi:hypothetical protein